MLKIKLIKDYCGVYICEDFKSHELDILFNFLQSDIGGYNSAFIKWILDEESLEIGSNLTYLEKQNDNIVLTDLMDDNPERMCVLSKSNFLKLLDKWKKIYEKKPQQLIMSKKNNEFVLEVEI